MALNTTLESIKADFGDRVGDCHRGQACATPESAWTDRHCALLYVDSCSTCHSTFKFICNIPYIENTIRLIVIPWSFLKSNIAYKRDCVGDGHRGQACATTESSKADFDDRVGNSDRSQACAIKKRTIADFGNRIGDGDRGQAPATRKSITAYKRDCVVDGHRGQACAKHLDILAD